MGERKRREGVRGREREREGQREERDIEGDRQIDRKIERKTEIICIIILYIIVPDSKSKPSFTLSPHISQCQYLTSPSPFLA